MIITLYLFGSEGMGNSGWEGKEGKDRDFLRLTWKLKSTKVVVLFRLFRYESQAFLRSKLIQCDYGGM